MAEFFEVFKKMQFSIFFRTVVVATDAATIAEEKTVTVTVTGTTVTIMTVDAMNIIATGVGTTTARIVGKSRVRS